MDQPTRSADDYWRDLYASADLDAAEDDGYPPDHAAMLARQWGYYLEDEAR